jgi:hypothetical protein
MKKSNLNEFKLSKESAQKIVGGGGCYTWQKTYATNCPDPDVFWKDKVDDCDNNF